MQNFLITASKKGARLDSFLKKHMPEFSRAKIQRAIKDGNVFVNTKTAKSSYLLKENDSIEAHIERPETPKLIPKKMDIPVLFENEDYLVINKPAGIAVHPSEKTREGTVANWLLWEYPNIQNIGDDPLRPGIVHRLDKDTSGVMLAAKTQKSFLYFKKLFLTREVGKKYLALIWGIPHKKEGEIHLPISRSKSDPTKRKAVANKIDKGPGTVDRKSTPAKEAVTFYRTIKQYENFTLTEAYPKTGRTHQIRVHFAAIGHPVAGDAKYGKKRAIAGLPRQFLHAECLSFRNKGGLQQEFCAPLPPDLQSCLKTLK